MQDPSVLDCTSVVASDHKYFALCCAAPFTPFQIEQPSEEDLGSWGHHSDPSTVPDTILQCSAGDEVISAVHVSYIYISLICVKNLHVSDLLYFFLAFPDVLRL